MEQDLTNLVRIFESFPEVKLAYFFGSKANGTDGPLSDYDFAVYLDLDKKETVKMFDIKFNLEAKLSLELKTDKIDVVILNIVKSPEFKYSVIKDGKVIFEQEPYRVLVEPKILNEYFDFIYGLRKYGLTKA